MVGWGRLHWGGWGGRVLSALSALDAIGDGLGMVWGWQWVWCIHGLGREILVWTCMGILVWDVWIDIAVSSRRWVVWWVCG